MPGGGEQARRRGVGGLPRAVEEMIGEPGRRDVPVAGLEQAALVAATLAGIAERPLVILAPRPDLADRAAQVARFVLQGGPVPYAFPRWVRSAESPYDEVVEGPYLAAARLGTLGLLAFSDQPFLWALDGALAARGVLPFRAFSEGVFRLEAGRDADLTVLVETLAQAGYRRVQTVSEIGEFAVRGGVVDFFTPVLEDPVRAEWDGDQVARMRIFDPATQRAERPLHRTWVVPVWEVPGDPGALREALIRLRDFAAARGVPGTRVSEAETAIASGRTPPGFQAMLPLIHGPLDLPLDYLGEDALVAVLDPGACREGADGALEDLRQQARTFSGPPRLAADPEDLASPGQRMMERLLERPGTVTFDLSSGGILGPAPAELQSSLWVRASGGDLPVAARVRGLRDLLSRVIEGGKRVLLLAPSESEAERVRTILSSEGVTASRAMRDGLLEVWRVPGAEGSVRIGVGRTRTAFGIEATGLLVLPTEAVFGLKDVLSVRKGERRGAKTLTEWRDLRPGDLVVHRDHGIGRFEGMVSMDLQGRMADCLVLSYAAGDRLYVPVDRSDTLEKYIGAGEGTPGTLDRLGSPVFARRKARARKAARDIAGRLKALYARRMAASARALEPPDADYREFEATFPYETTPDQERAIEEVIEDLVRDRPMDRLVCGDVGFGKTEVAIRAAYLAVQQGLQVAVLVPTTLLAEQHRLNFLARFRHTPVVIESLSRFKGPKEARRVIGGLADGSVDIVIGTHRILSEDVRFRRLGLLVVDEEHRFGVVHKERLREMSASVHTLTLTATPIPRTLHMALAGIRDLSVIATPPQDRLAVRTYVARPSPDLIRSAILREVGRGGQVFYLHNRIEDIYDFADRVQRLVPEARVTVAHGAMSADDLESVMGAFVRGEKDTLVCTTLIESGIDIATANTLLVDRADTLGLAQLYQLRGRVGRSAEQAYCYLLVPDPSRMTEEARRRIEAIERFSDLASGFHLAAMDLEIRGAGDLLGADQSGHLAAVGLDLFLEMLQDALRELSGEEPPDRLDTEVRLRVDARIPPEYLPDETLRLRAYRRLARAEDLREVARVAGELADRYGRPPPPVERLLGIIRVKVLARALGIQQVIEKGTSVRLVAAPGREAGIDRVAAAGTLRGLRGMARPERGVLEVPLPRAGGLVAMLESLLGSGDVPGGGGVSPGAGMG